ncbi:hypothetical protein [Deinococcus sp. UR1]|uniref:hypothetical protein n=1 Tax=Deinococcus sp. UR1 TaxID=1704277 RepID=UPI000C18C6AD|nr:hypothetical protein [Deinococcus sp. UR1]PIG96876.1 hypothetical protein AMD26_015215 [Deinococcus sp. UR1]
MIDWVIPAAEHHAVTVRVGRRGAVIPATRSAVFAGQEQVPCGALQVRYAPTDAPLTIRLSMRDLARVAPDNARVYLTATVYHRAGTTEHTLNVTVSNAAPDGLVFAYITPDGTYFTADGLPAEPLTLTVTCEDGSTYTTSNPGAGALFVEGERRIPVRVTAADAEDRESDDLLAGVDVEPDGPPDSTDLSEWPLPSYLRADAPNVSALLRAFEAALDLRPDLAGLYVSPSSSVGPALTRAGELFGVDRVDAPTDGNMRRRIKAALTRDKATLAGLETMLRAHGIFGARIVDMELAAGPAGLLHLDGTWTLDGSRLLDGGVPGWDVLAGQVLAVFRRAPVAGLGAALRVLRRYKAAGVHARVLLRAESPAASPAPGAHGTMTARRAFPMLRAPYGALVLDGTWNLDGTQSLNGVKVTPTQP